MVDPNSLQLPSALSQACEIARSASGAIDWFREPLTERERRIRERYLQRFFENEYDVVTLVLKGSGLECEAQIYNRDRAGERRAIASDMSLALARARSIWDQERASDEASVIADIMDGLDAEQSA
mgnify:CR=1 FL=1